MSPGIDTKMEVVDEHQVDVGGHVLPVCKCSGSTEASAA